MDSGQSSSPKPLKMDKTYSDLLYHTVLVILNPQREQHFDEKCIKPIPVCPLKLSVGHFPSCIN